ncbi:MAG TPA: phospholipase D-like domain-containing protein, partial [Streptosporangiaceae bacterium]|nr:phospholipase D-like domain-containing protein [Streptosporangiaceae bacterium]
MTSGSRLAAAVEAAFRGHLASGAAGSAPGTSPGSALAQEIAAVLAARGEGGLRDEIDRALRELANRTDRVSLAVTGLGWLGEGVPAVERTLTELLASAEQEILLTAYSMTPGSGRVWDALETAISTGVHCTLVSHRLKEQHPDTRALLLGLRARFPGVFRLYTFAGTDERDVLHAKLVVIDRRVALVGSPNLTFHGMVAAHELAVVVRGPAADRIAG